MNDLPRVLGEGEEVKKPLFEMVDVASRVRAGSLSAHGLTDQQIADVLLLTIEQIRSVRECNEYKTKYAEVANELIEQQLDLAEGWDAVEQKAIAKVLTSLDYMADPKFALAAASIANKADRRKKIKDVAPVIDASQAGQTNNIIVLQLNKNYIQNQKAADGSDARVINADVIDKSNQPRKRVDLPTPQAVEQLLAPVKNTPKDAMMTEVERLMTQAGVVLDINDE